MLNLGRVIPGSKLYIPFNSFAADGASGTISGFATTDIKIYKNGSTTERANQNGYTLLDTDGIDFDGIQGANGFSVDLANNTDAGFYSAGDKFLIHVGPITVATKTVNLWVAAFEIGYPDAILNTTIATRTSQTVFTLSAGPADDDALNGCPIIIHDIASGIQIMQGVVNDYVGSTKQVTLYSDPGIFTTAVGDNVSIFLAQNEALTRTLETVFGSVAREEPTALPPVNPSVFTKLDYLYKSFRNMITISTTEKTYFNDDNSAAYKKTVSDDGNVYTENKVISS